MAGHEHVTAVPSTAGSPTASVGSAAPVAVAVAVAAAVVVARALLAAVAGLALVALAPSVLHAGWWTGVVVSGSMSPAVGVGDVVVTRPVPGAPRPGQVLAVRDPLDPSRVLVHRFSGFSPDGRLVTQGDANAEPDSTPVARGALLGVGVLRVPYVGRPVVWARSGDVTPLVGSGAALGLTGLLAARRTGVARARRGAGRHANH